MTQLDKAEEKALAAGLADIAAGRVQSLESIDAELKGRVDGPPPQGCINCGESARGGYMSGREGHVDEGAVGPFCGECWQLLQEDAAADADVATLRQQLAQAQEDVRDFLEQHKTLCAELESLRQQFAGAREEREHWRAHYEAALVNWNEMIRRAEAAEATVASLRQLLGEAFVVLEGLRIGVEWELAPVIKTAIAKSATEIQAALAALPTPSREETRSPQEDTR